MRDFLVVRNLKKFFPVQKGFLQTFLTRRLDYVKAVDNVDFFVKKGEIFGLVGESGSGKTTTGRLLVRLLEPTEGVVEFDGVNIYELNGGELRKLRRRAQIIFQDPTASLNPRTKIGDAISLPLTIHGDHTHDERKEIVYQILDKTGLSPPEEFYERYPHQLSGGQKQRAVIARALILNPEFVVADEPVAMVDVSVRAQILELMLDLKREYDLTYVFITHDLAVARYLCDRIAIMYLGKIMELGSKEQIFRNPQHPYTQALLSAIPIPDPKAKREKMIPKGEIPSAISPPSGCRFHPRCPYAMPICSGDIPRYVETEPGHYVACVLYYPELSQSLPAFPKIAS